jgi:hypothetical protein
MRNGAAITLNASLQAAALIYSDFDRLLREIYTISGKLA